ncbi:MAG: hypothetical protein EZS28_001459 [Streblomastix strix]|uniref:Uncharacterized protein n=1 Tax=Streblomastix strix TaxID=222440 RepID=A0A5J4X8C7_9EUKA|nr:MAG: hypothetical protein EZS28_001459 [Streblomastix strix]
MSADDKKSISSASSSSSSQAAALNVIRFNAIDEVLFAMLYTFHKEPRNGQFFYVFEACIVAFQSMAVSFRRLGWPLRSDILEIINDIFRYIGFSIAWRSEILLILLTIVLGVLTLVLMVGVAICTMLNKRGSTAVPVFAKIINVGVVMLSGIFYTPCVSVFIGSTQCYTITSDPESAATISCGTAMRLLFLIIGLLFLVILVPFTFLIRLFIFSHNHKKEGIFTMQTGVFFTVLQIGSTLMQIIGLVLRTEKLIIALMGTFVYGITVLYLLILQPYFHPLGNTVWSSLITIVFTCYFIGIPVSILDTSKIWVIVIVWSLFIPAVIGLPILIGWMTYKRGRSLWAVREDEDISSLLSKEDSYLMQNQQLNQNQKKFNAAIPQPKLQLMMPQNKMKMGEALRSSKQNIPNIVERWMVYAMTHDLERESSSKSGSNSVGVAFRLRFDKGTKAHEFSKAYLTQSYSQLTRDHVDLERIMTFFDKAITYERESRQILEDLMKQYPGDDDNALQMFNEATAIEEDNAQQDGTKSGEQKEKMSIGARSQSGQSSGQKSGSQGTKKRKKKRQSKAQQVISTKNSENLIPGFLQIVIGCMIMVISVLIISFILSINDTNNCKITVQSMNDCSSMMVTSISIFLYVEFLELRYRAINDPLYV